eukprot:9677583-Alexandrium_andersonii.AAC.1
MLSLERVSSCALFATARGLIGPTSLVLGVHRFAGHALLRTGRGWFTIAARLSAASCACTSVQAQSWR